MKPLFAPFAIWLAVLLFPSPSVVAPAVALPPTNAPTPPSLAAKEQSTTAESLPKIITGRVVRAADGSPVAGAKVGVEHTCVATDAQGRFELHHDQDGWRNIWVNASGLAVESRDIDTGKTRIDGVEFKMLPSSQIRGRIVDEQGKPVVGARVSSGNWPDRQARSDTNGKFLLDPWRPKPPGVITVEAVGFQFKVVRNPPPNDAEVVLRRAPATALAGEVTTADGNPVDEAYVHLIPKPSPTAQRGWRPRYLQVSKTAADGAFVFPVDAGSYDLLALADDESQAALATNLSVVEGEQQTNITIVLQPRGWITGRVNSSQPARFAHKEFSVEPLDFGWQLSWVYREAGVTDDAGRFRVSTLLPGRYVVKIYNPQHEDEPLLEQPAVVSQQTTEIVVGVKFPGVVRGRLVGLTEDREGQPLQLRPVIQSAVAMLGASTDANGRFEFVDLPPGEYRLTLDNRTGDGDTLRGSTPLTVTDSPDPVVANLEVQRIVRPKFGQVAPNFTLRDPEGQPVKLSDLRGKFVFLDFWATWCGPCRGEIPHLKELANKFGGRDDFVLLSVSIDEDEMSWRECIKKERMNWRHALDKNGWHGGVAARYGVTAIPATFLLGKDGKVLKIDLRGPSVVSEVGALLGIPADTTTPNR